ncbi:hypothetical protein [Saccharothrix texasensis]|uniref:Secreted protein n=1 Tax=Saccharothrix texasensis TaxID=103734 RepID=A0A3N1H5M8_9PSEU|nr:hypothetical protein [Saccharothrix texasensis]ROP37819.1 hypothetical protein EDD40_3145 [Saccharothrix texasensis]
MIIAKFAAKFAASVAAVLVAAVWSVAPAGPAVAAAGIAVTGVSVGDYPDSGLWVSGTATCSTTTGTGVVDVSALQVLFGANASGWGATTVSCADQPAYWSVFASTAGACFHPGTGSGCFQRDSLASVFATLTRGGAQEAFHGDAFPT